MIQGGSGRLTRRIVCLVAGLLLLLSTRLAGALSYYDVAPQGSVGVSRPTISQQFLLGSGETIKRATMWIDGTRVEPGWSRDGLVAYTPPAPLSVGLHTARLSVEVAAGSDRFTYDPVESTFTFRVVAGAADALAQPGPEERRALDWVNAYRRDLKLAPMTYNTALGAASRSHATYLVTHPEQTEINAHGETLGTTLYTGAHSGERAHYWAYPKATAEVINFTDRAESAVDGWMDTIYHRIPLIHPGYTEMGYGVAAKGSELANVLVAGPGDAGSGTVLWPYDGQTGVPTGWDGLEVPNPFRLYPDAKGPVGYTITMTFGGRPRTLSLTSYSLAGPGGNVPVLAFDPANDDHLSDTVALIPRAPLAPGARYTVTMAGLVDDRTFNRTWSFTTAGGQPPEVQRMSSRTLGGTLQSVGVEGSGFGSGVKVFLGGLPVESLSVTSNSQLTFSPPVGLNSAGQDMLLVTAEGREVLWRSFIPAGQYVLPYGTPFTRVGLTVHGVPYPTPALAYRSGAVLLPEGALAEMGAGRMPVEAIGRTYWSWGGKMGDYTFGRVASAVESDRFRLAMPVQEQSGTTYVDREFAAHLTGLPLPVYNGQISLGLRDIGTHWAKPQVVRLLRDGVISGTGDGTYRPDDTLTRGAFVKMLTVARSMTPQPGATGGFADTAGHWVSAQGFVGAAVSAGIVVPAEYPGRAFRPDGSISREEMAVMVTRALGLDAEGRAKRVTLSGSEATVAGRRFSDASTWNRAGYIAVAVEKGMITGIQEADGTYTFRPSRMASRAEAAVMVARTLAP